MRWDEMRWDDMMSALYYTNKLSGVFILQAHCNNSPLVDIYELTLHLLLNVIYLAEKQQKTIL
jgi:hypothetical protein